MKVWLNKDDCTGCGACSNICPKNAIKMIEDDCGFKYPKINPEKCIDCGLCKNICPILNTKKNKNVFNNKVFACWSKDEKNRFVSTSGGVFSEIAKIVIDNNGYVIGASYDDNNLVIHDIAHNRHDLEKLRQSKYLQSDTHSIYLQTKRLLDNNELVAFAGSPCQIAALKNYLRKDYSNLLTIEFICRGMNSPKAYKAWLSEIEHVENKKVVKVWFKYKENGWKTSPRRTKIDFDDGSSKIYEGKDNTYMCGYLGPNLYIRPSCGNCRFNGLPRVADITLADFWGIDKKYDDDKGTSLVILNSINAERYFESIKDSLIFFERSMDEIYEGNVCFNNSVKINKNSDKFLKKINDTNFSNMVLKYGKEPIYKKIYHKLKCIVKKIVQ